MITIRKKQRFGPVNISGLTAIGIINNTIGAFGILIKAHSGTAAGSSLAPALYVSGDGVSESGTSLVANAITAYPTTTPAVYNASEAAGNWQTFIATGGLPMLWPNLKLYLNSSATNDVIVDVWVLYHEGQATPPVQLVGLPYILS